MTPSIRLHHDNVNAIVVCPNCEGTEFVESGHAFHKNTSTPSYIYKCKGCEFKGTLDKMKLKTLDRKSNERT